MGWDTLHYPRLLQAPSNLLLDIPGIPASPDNMFQCLTTPFIKKNLLLISNQNLVSFSLKHFPLILSM